MQTSNKVVTKIPLDKIWNQDEEIEATRTSHLTAAEISDMLKKYPVEFVVANCGDKLKWINVDKCYEFWKSEASNRIADNISKIDLDKYRDNYAYIASQWSGQIQTPIILLEKIH